MFLKYLAVGVVVAAGVVLVLVVLFMIAQWRECLDAGMSFFFCVGHVL